MSDTQAVPTKRKNLHSAHYQTLPSPTPGIVSGDTPTEHLAGDSSSLAWSWAIFDNVSTGDGEVREDIPSLDGSLATSSLLSAWDQANPPDASGATDPDWQLEAPFPYLGSPASVFGLPPVGATHYSPNNGMNGRQDDQSDYTGQSLPLSFSSAGWDEHETSERQSTQPSGSLDQLNTVSSSSTDHLMMKRSNQGMISQNLLQIYHDVLEHNLSCWLTELTCPYKVKRGLSRTRTPVSEWGSSWSNRIYHRTLKLDLAARRAGFLELQPSEVRACNKALHLAIMAFATQWAQNSHRQHEQCSLYPKYSRMAERPNSISDAGVAEEFDRTLQWHFWKQAEAAIQDTSRIESFTAICAELVLGLAQRPRSQDASGTFASREDMGERLTDASLRTKIAREIASDGPPVNLERAARKMHALKFRWDRSLASPSSQPKTDAAARTTAPLSQEDQTTVGLLYWLAIMFDTVSSSMNERPVVVPDYDSQHGDCQNDDGDYKGWDVDLFIQDKLESPRQATRWPCAYEAAAEAVTKSGPVKVLLYRHVSYLQNALRRGKTGSGIEQVIQNSMSLYRYWNRTYGIFFRDLVLNFSTVPGRIRSWFVCISAHWHLACLILSDLVHTVDREGQGVREETEKRLNSRVIDRMQEASARELADLARVATPLMEDTSSSEESQPFGFHPSVSQATILTEPWTEILIRAFSRATMLFLADAESRLQCGLGVMDGQKISDTLQQAEHCVRGLWFLGKKSDMARRVADILTPHLSALNKQV